MWCTWNAFPWFEWNLECSALKCAKPITARVCTRHDSVAVVTCAKFRDRPKILWTRALQSLIEFRISILNFEFDRNNVSGTDALIDTDRRWWFHFLGNPASLWEACRVSIIEEARVREVARSRGDFFVSNVCCNVQLLKGRHWITPYSFMSCLHSLLGYSTWEFQALKLIVLAAFGAVD